MGQDKKENSMHYIPIEKVSPGMILGSAIYDTDGRVLLSQETPLTEAFIEGLVRHGYAGIYVNDKISEGIEVKSAIPIQLRSEGMECLKNQDIDGCKRVASAIVDSMLANENVSLDLMDLRSFSDQTYAHSVNVAVFCSIMGLAASFSKEKLENIVLAALLHDIGKTHIPEDVLNKPGRLTPSEYEIIKTHSKLSYDMIKDRMDIPIEVKTAVLYHHENVDGSGYPRGMTGDEMSDYIKFIHVADVYDALVSKRPYKKPYSPYEACEYLMGGCGIMFDQYATDILTKNVPMFPKGMEVELSDGRKGIIFENAGIYNLRPLIRLMDETMLDLSLKENLSIFVIPPKSDSMANISAGDDEGPAVPDIWIVDDMQTNIVMLQKILSDNCITHSFKSGDEVVRAIQTMEYPQLVLMDIDMPGMNGIKAAEKILEVTNRKVPILFVSSLCDRETVMACKRLNVAGYVARPYNDIYVLSEIRRILDVWGDL